jgi:hypothetical protein
MNRSLAQCLLLVGLLGLAAGSLPVEAAREVSGKGRFTSSVYFTKFRFTARGGPGNATGAMRFAVNSSGGASSAQEGTVDCLRVEGDRLVVAGELTAGPFAGTYFAVRAEDNGRDRRHPYDEIAWNYGADDPFSCADFNLSGELDAHRLDSGDIKVD